MEKPNQEQKAKRSQNEVKVPKQTARAAASASASSTSIIDDPLPGDVILGRGSANAWRPGNSLLHQLVDHYQSSYHSTQTRKNKANIVSTIYETMRSQGRFLKRVGDTDTFKEVDEKVAMEKIAHTLRDRRPKGASTKSEAAKKSSDSTRLLHGNASASSPSTYFSLPPLMNLPDGTQYAASMPVPLLSMNSGTNPYSALDSKVGSREHVRAATAQQSHPHQGQKAGISNPTTATGEGGTITIPDTDIFADDELQSVLGHPDEYNDKQN